MTFWEALLKQKSTPIYQIKKIIGQQTVKINGEEMTLQHYLRIIEANEKRNEFGVKLYQTVETSAKYYLREDTVELTKSEQEGFKREVEYISHNITMPEAMILRGVEKIREEERAKTIPETQKREHHFIQIKMPTQDELEEGEGKESLSWGHGGNYERLIDLFPSQIEGDTKTFDIANAKNRDLFTKRLLEEMPKQKVIEKLVKMNENFTQRIEKVKELGINEKEIEEEVILKALVYTTKAPDKRAEVLKALLEIGEQTSQEEKKEMIKQLLTFDKTAPKWRGAILQIASRLPSRNSVLMSDKDQGR